MILGLGGDSEPDSPGCPPDLSSSTFYWGLKCWQGVKSPLGRALYLQPGAREAEASVARMPDVKV